MAVVERKVCSFNHFYSIFFAVRCKEKSRECPMCYYTMVHGGVALLSLVIIIALAFWLWAVWTGGNSHRPHDERPF